MMMMMMMGEGCSSPPVAVSLLFSSVVFSPKPKCLWIWTVCAGELLSTVSRVCLVLHSSHSSDCLTTVQVLSFAVVQERVLLSVLFCCLFFFCVCVQFTSYAGVGLYWPVVTPTLGWRPSRGGQITGTRWNFLNVSARRGGFERGEGGGRDLATWQIPTQLSLRFLRLNWAARGCFWL